MILQDACQKGAVDLAGLCALDLESYKSAMKSTGKYECLVTYDSIGLLSFAHKSLAPALGLV